MLAMDLGKQLDYLLEERELSRKEAAKDLGIAPSTLSSYITNARQPDLDMLVRIADYYSTSIDFLLEYSPKPTSSRRVALYQQHLMHITQNFTAEQMELLNKTAVILSRYKISK